MKPSHYFRIVLELLRRAPCRLLVVGAGNDTELYVNANAGGKSVVLEDHSDWIERIKHLNCTVLPVSYCTKLEDGPLEPCPLPDWLPSELLNDSWDVILVDAPHGFYAGAPGRQQSIFLASQLARPGTTVFLHDWDRPAEQSFAARYLKQPDERYGEKSALAVFHYPAASSR